MGKYLWCFGYRSNDDTNEYHHLGASPQFSLAVRDVCDWAHDHDDYPTHLLYVTEYIDGAKNQSLTLDEWYFHTLCLYSIMKKKKMWFLLEDQQGEKAVEIEEVLRDLFKSSYCEFLLRFGGTEELIAAID